MKNKELFLRIIAVLAALIVWELVSFIIDSPILIVGPSRVLLRLFTLIPTAVFWKSVGFTLVHIFGGYLSGLALGILLAVVAYRIGVVKLLLMPWMATVKSVPVASFVVICLIWLSPANLSIFISFLIVLPICYQNILNAMEGIDSSLTDLAELENLSYFGRLRNIFFPNISDKLISTASLSAGIAWKAGVAAEVIGTPSGSIGRQLYLAKTFLATDDLLAWTVVIVLLSVGFEKLFVLVLRRLIC